MFLVSSSGRSRRAVLAYLRAGYVSCVTTQYSDRLTNAHVGSPSTSVTEINARQSLVAFFHARPFLRQDLVQNLRDAEDATRIVQKFLLGRGSYHDLTAICTTIDIWTSIKERILMEKSMEGRDVEHMEWASIEALMDRLSDLDSLARRIRMSLSQRESAVSEGDVDIESEFPTITPVPVRDPRNPLGIAEWIIKPE